MSAVAQSEECKTPPSRKTLPADQALPIKSEKAVVPVIPLMSKEEGERLISQMPKRSLAEALEMKERMLGRL
jgi:hypothetical protein